MPVEFEPPEVPDRPGFDYAPQAQASPSDFAVDIAETEAFTAMNAARRQEIIDNDDVIGLCSECKSEQPFSYMQGNIFAREGVPIPCKFCGGVCVLTYRELAPNVAKRLDSVRGIDRS